MDSTTFYFYDLETSGINARSSRIMQFAGQRTDMQLKPIGLPDDILVALTPDVLPEPDAIMLTGITPQKTIQEGITEAEFLKYFHSTIALPGTIFVGFNNIRFDDEFMRFTNYRNFYDAYEWTWKDRRSRWDLLDVVRMTRALRPDGVEWPFDSNGKPSNRLGLLTSLNKLEHTDAHNALSDVRATIAVARLLRNKQEKLFEYLLKMRDKKAVESLVQKNQPFVYTSGKYPSLYHKTTVVASLGQHPGKQGVLVFDLRRNPTDFMNLSPADIALQWRERVDDETQRFPIKMLQINRSPAVAPLSVLDSDSQERIHIDMQEVGENFKRLQSYPELYQKLCDALHILDKKQQATLVTDDQQVDSQLYDGFFADGDKTAMSVVRATDTSDIGSLDMPFSDERLARLFPLYKARNFAQTLTTEERQEWEKFRSIKLLSGGAHSTAQRYFERLNELAQRKNLSSNDQYLLEELQLYGQSILPLPDDI
jgi:exodeoxyribonuclease-1